MKSLWVALGICMVWILFPLHVCGGLLLECVSADMLTCPSTMLCYRNHSEDLWFETENRNKGIQQYDIYLIKRRHRCGCPNKHVLLDAFERFARYSVKQARQERIFKQGAAQYRGRGGENKSLL